MLPKMVFHRDYVAGTYDANGQFMGGTEVVHLRGHKGSLYAGVGFWDDEPGADPRLGAQVLRKDSADGEWVVDKSWTNVWRINSMCSITFTIDSDGNKLKQPATLLMVAPSDIIGGQNRAMVWVRDDNTGDWIETVIAPGQGYARALYGPYRDKITGIEHIFAGCVKGIFRGCYDPSVEGFIRWEATPEISSTGSYTFTSGGFKRTYYTRFIAFTEANGRLYASQEVVRDVPDEGGMLVRTDGENPSWEYVHRRDMPPEAITAYTDPRGTTAVPATENGGHDVVIGVWEWSGIVDRIDPENNNEVIAEFDILEYVKAQWGGVAKEAIFAAYNRFTPVINPADGRQVHLFGIWAWHPQRLLEQPYNGGWYCVRYGNGTYEVRNINDPENPIPLGKELGACRDIEVSPFPEDEGKVFYFCGPDAGASAEYHHNDAWIYRAEYK